MVARACSAVKADGRLCRATPMRDSAFCFYHNPETEEEATEARRLGGLRRRREKTLAGAYDMDALDNVGSIRRLLEIATFDVIGLENSIARARVLISAVLAAAKLLETGELQARIELLEAALKSRPDSETGGSGGLLGEH